MIDIVAKFQENLLHFLIASLPWFKRYGDFTELVKFCLFLKFHHEGYAPNKATPSRFYHVYLKKKVSLKVSFFPIGPGLPLPRSPFLGREAGRAAQWPPPCWCWVARSSACPVQPGQCTRLSHKAAEMSNKLLPQFSYFLLTIVIQKNGFAEQLFLLRSVPRVIGAY